MIQTALSITAFALTSVWAAPSPQFDSDGSPFQNSSPFANDIDHTGFLVERGQRIAFTVGMVILGLIIAGLVFWFIVACCIGGAAIRASNRRRRPYFYGNGPGVIPSMTANNAAMTANNAAMASNTAAMNAATAGAPPGGAAPPSYPNAAA